MNRKQRMDEFVNELNQKYQPDERLSQAIEPIIAKLYDPTVPEDQMDKLLKLTEETYQRHCQNKANIQSAKEGLAKIAQNLQKGRELYQKQIAGLKEIASNLESLSKNLPAVQSVLDSQNRTLKDVHERLLENNQKLQDAKRTLEEAASSPATHYPTDPKKLN